MRSGTWEIKPEVGMVQDGPRLAVPASAVRRTDAESGSSWVVVPGTRWGWAAPSLAARVNCELLEARFPFVQRVVADDESWRQLMCQAVDEWRLTSVMQDLHAGEAIDAEALTAAMRRLLRERVEEVEGPAAVEDIAARALSEHGVRLCGIVEEAVAQAYLLVSAETVPLPVVTATDVEFPAHDVVVDRLVTSVVQRPELVTSRDRWAGAGSVEEYERWLGIG